MTTFRSYGAVSTKRQGEILRQLGSAKDVSSPLSKETIRELGRYIKKLEGGGNDEEDT